MTQEFHEAAEDPRDYTKYVWGGIGVLVLAMLTFMLVKGQSTPQRSQVDTKHILISFAANDPADRARALELIQSIREKIVSGEASFEAMAQKYSDDPLSARNGGYIGSSGRGELQDKYEDFAWIAPPGELSDIIQTGFGYHLIVVVDRYISPGDAYEEALDKRLRDAAEDLRGAAAGDAPAP